MTNKRFFPDSMVTFAAALLVVGVMIACTETKQVPPPPSASEKVFVIFEGPWGFAADPKDPNFILAIAPKTKDHRDLYVQASNYSVLASGIYDLSVPARTMPATGTIAPNIVQTKLDAPAVQKALDDKLERYAIRLPKPEAYTAESRYRSRVGSTYPPDVSTEQDYATAVSLRYSVSSLNGFSLAGTPDSGHFDPLLLQVDTPNINFMITQAHDDDPADKCETHSRQAFHDLTKLLSLTLYVDFPNNPSECHDKDPQKPPAARAQDERPSLLKRLAMPHGDEMMDLQEATVIPTASLSLIARAPVRGIAQHIMAAIYFFAAPTGGCKAPIVVGNNGG